MTPNKEDYLKIIFELGGEFEKVSNKQIVTSLNVSPASVSEMITKLVKEDYITHIPYQGVQLTQKGLLEAASLVRKHRLWEVFLVDELKLAWNDVHEEAEVLEHVASSKVIDRLEEYLHYPKTCPHGGVIPNAKGHFDEESHLALADCPENETLVIKRVLDDRELLDYLMEIGLSVEDEVQITHRTPYDGPLMVNNLTKNAEIQVGEKASKHIFVVENN